MKYQLLHNICIQKIIIIYSKKYFLFIDDTVRQLKIHYLYNTQSL